MGRPRASVVVGRERERGETNGGRHGCRPPRALFPFTTRAALPAPVFFETCSVACPDRVMDSVPRTTTTIQKEKRPGDNKIKGFCLGEKEEEEEVEHGRK